MTDLIKEIEELKKKAVRYENIKERNNQLIKLLEAQIEINKEMTRILKPYEQTEKTGTRRKTENREIIEEVYSKIMEGDHMTREKLQTIYNELTNTDAGNIMQTIKKMPNILSTIDGSKLRLYAKKEM